jgi:hypothetical protein
MWQQAAWMRTWDIGVGHVSGGRLSADEVDVSGPIDAFVMEYGAALLEFQSFWECTCFLFYANRPLYLFYRAYGLVERIRAIEYRTMPSQHPNWADGNATDTRAENGQSQYGASWTAAHLMTRRLLFDDDRASLFQIYLESKTSAAASTWYAMQLPQIAGPLMLALLEAPHGFSASSADETLEGAVYETESA